MKSPIMQQQIQSRDLLQYLGSRQHSRNGSETSITRATDSFSEMFNSIITRNTIHNHQDNDVFAVKQQKNPDPQKNEKAKSSDEVNALDQTVQSEPSKRETEGTENNHKSVENGKNEKNDKNEKSETNFKETDKTAKNSQIVSDKEKPKKEELKDSLSADMKELAALLETLRKNSPKDEKSTEELQSKISDLLKSVSSKLDQLMQMKHSAEDTQKLAAMKKLIDTFTKAQSDSVIKITDTKLISQLQIAAEHLEKMSPRERFQSLQTQKSENIETQKNENTVGMQTVNHDAEAKDTGAQSKSGGNAFSFSEADHSRIQKTLVREAASPKQGGIFREQVNDLIQRSRMVVQDKQNSSISLKMYPERLGNVTVNLGLENGILSGRFLVESQEAKETLLANMQQLRERLEEEGITFGSFQVNVRDNGAQFGQKQQEDSAAPLEYFNPQSEAAFEYGHTSEYDHSGSLNLII